MRSHSTGSRPLADALLRCGLAILIATAAGRAPAQEAPLPIGISLPLTGLNSAAGQEVLAVAQAYFNGVNKSGGINGRRIVLKVLDDEFQADKAAQNAAKLASEGVVALFNCWGTSNCSAMMAIAAELKVPLVSGIAGGGALQDSPGRYGFNVRPSTEAEISRIVQQMRTVGQNRIAIVYQDDGFGRGGLAAAQRSLTAAAVTPVGTIALAPSGTNADTVVEALKKSGPDGILLLASPAPTVRVITRARQQRIATPFYNLAAQATSNVVRELGEHTHGVVFTTLVPSPWRTQLPMVREYQKIYAPQGGNTNYSYLGFEVFINAHVLATAIRGAGRNPSRESLTAALENMDELSVAPRMAIKYGPRDRAGSNYVGIAIIGSQGRFTE